MSAVIVVAGWEKFQHYKDRDPPWIKLYRDLLTAESWVLGTDESRLVQLASMLLAARYRNATPLNYALFRKVASLDMSEAKFKAAMKHLCATGFLEIQEDTEERKQSASSVLATCTSETEAEKIRVEAEGSAEGRGNGAHAPSPPPKTKASRIPENWTPSPDLVAYAERELPGVDVEKLAEAFRDFWIAAAGERARKLNWAATWRTWVRRSARDYPTKRQPAPLGQIPGKRAPPTDEQIAVAHREAAEANRRELASKLGVLVRAIP